MDRGKIERGVRLILEGIGETPSREGLYDTPGRMTDLYEEIFQGIGVDPQEKLKVYKAKNKDEMIIIKDISFYSMCEHHLLPFFGKVHIAYIPSSNNITGFSSLARVVDTLSKRPQLQERMTTDIADYIIRAIQPKGILVVIEAEHMCLTMRGVKKPGSKALTSAIRGIMREEATRMEAFMMIMRGE